VAAGTPIVLGTSACVVETMAELPPGFDPSARPGLAAAIEGVLPLVPLRAWPLSLDRLLKATLEDNPFYDAMVHADPFDADGFATSYHELLFEPSAAHALRQRAAEYRARVEQLPAGDDVLLAMLQ
jgi:hypothetical protein